MVCHQTPGRWWRPYLSSGSFVCGWRHTSSGIISYDCYRSKQIAPQYSRFSMLLLPYCTDINERSILSLVHFINGCFHRTLYHVRTEWVTMIFKCKTLHERACPSHPSKLFSEEQSKQMFHGQFAEMCVALWRRELPIIVNMRSIWQLTMHTAGLPWFMCGTCQLRSNRWGKSDQECK
jgi:hypothetical protein